MYRVISRLLRRLFYEQGGYSGKGVWVGLGMAIAVAGGGLIYQQVTASDTTVPSVTLTAPANAATVSGTIAVSATASDNVGVTLVEFLRAGSSFNSDASSPYSVNFDTTTVANGSHTFAARASDAAGNQATSAGATVTVSNGVSGTCPLPAYPDASCTGVPTGTSLTAYSGANPVTVNGTVIDSKTITSCPLAIQASGVIIRNSRFTCNNSGALYVDDDLNYARSSSGTVSIVTVEDSELDCGVAAGTHGVSEAHFTLRRVEVTGCENGVDANQNILIEDSYIHNLAAEGADPHEDGIQFASHWTGSAFVCCGLNITIRHNTIFGMGNGDTTFGTSAIITAPSGDVNILIEENLLAGGAATVYCNRPGQGTNFDLFNNHFSTQFGPNVGSFFPADDCGDETVSGNVIHETGQPVDLG